MIYKPEHKVRMYYNSSQYYHLNVSISYHLPLCPSAPGLTPPTGQLPTANCQPHPPCVREARTSARSLGASAAATTVGYCSWPGCTAEPD